MVPSDEGLGGLAAIAFLAGTNITFTAALIDSESDHLTFIWDGGDGTVATATTNHTNGASPDTYPSPGGTFPFTATDTKIHAYPMAGGHMVTLRIGDDDGGTASYTFTLGIW
jgi:hypothetical protein